MSYYVVTSKNKWAHDNECLLTAMRKAGLKEHCLSEEQALYLEESIRDGDNHTMLLRALKEGKQIYKDEHDLEDPELVDFQVIAAKEGWEFNGADPISGASNYLWKGEGPKPDKVEAVNLKLTFNMVTGEITPRK